MRKTIYKIISYIAFISAFTSAAFIDSESIIFTIWFALSLFVLYLTIDKDAESD